MTRTRCHCPACTVAAAVTLLERGRDDMALTILRPVPEVLAEALGAAYAAGCAAKPRKPDRRRPQPERPQRSGKPAFRRVAAELREHVTRLGADRVAELLGVDLDDLGPLLEGRVDVAKSALERVRRAG